MIVFEKISIQNFMSFAELEFEIPRTGLHHMIGENGVGKSSIWEALSFCLFARTVRGLQADDVARRERSSGEPCVVKVEFSIDNTQYVVRRSRFPTTLELKRDGVSISLPSIAATQEKIIEVLGMTFQVFTNSVYFPQGLPYRFTQVGDSEKKAVLDDILQLEWLEGSRQNVRGVRQNELTRAFRLKEEKVVAETRKKVLEEAREELQKRLSDFHHQLGQMEKSASSMESEEATKTEIEETKYALSEAAEGLEVRKEDLDELQKEYRRLRDEHNAESILIASRDIEHEGCQKQINTINADVEVKEKYVGGKCPTCGQQVTKEGVSGAIKELGRQKENWEKRAIELTIELTELNKRQAEVEKELHDCEGQQEIIADEKEGVEEEVRVARIKLEELREREGRIRTHLALIEEKRQHLQELEDQIDGKRGDIDSTTEELKQLEQQLAELETKTKELDFWIEGFGNRGIKSMLLDSVVPMLNESAVAYSNFLTDGKISVQFRSTSETKAGETRDKLSVVVQEKKASDSYMGCSGGERRRADVVVLLALHDLISRRTQTSVNLLIFDEVTQSLDQEGTERFVELINEFAKDKAVYVISHQEGIESHFDNTIRVRKENGISKIA